MSTQLPKHSKENLSEIDFYCYFVRHVGSHKRFSSETAGLLVRKGKPRPQTSSGSCRFPSKAMVTRFESFLQFWRSCFKNRNVTVARMERKERCKKVKVVFMEIIKFQGFVITSLREHLTKRGFPAWFYFQILGMFYS